jgi:hypothetical protein
MRMPFTRKQVGKGKEKSKVEREWYKVGWIGLRSVPITSAEV